MASTPQTTTPAGASPATSKPAAAPASAAPAAAPAKAPAKAPAAKASPAKPAKQPAPKASNTSKPSASKVKPPAKASAKKASTTTTVPVGAQGNTAAEGKAKQEARGMGDNSTLTPHELETTAQAVADNLSGIMSGEAKIEKTKEQADTMRKQAAETLFPVLDRIGIRPDWGSDFTKNAKANTEFELLRESICSKISKKVRDQIEYTAKGKPIFSGRVKKAWSRLVTSFKEGGDGSQTEADSSAREAAKERSKVNTAKAEMMDHIITAYAEGDTDKIETLLKSAKGQWGKSLGV